MGSGKAQPHLAHHPAERLTVDVELGGQGTAAQQALLLNNGHQPDRRLGGGRLDVTGQRVGR
jgi:hypothetical protein